jgi:hypothetical protein
MSQRNRVRLLMLARLRQLMALDASMTCPHPVSLKNSSGSNQETLHPFSHICLPLIPFSYLTDRQEQIIYHPQSGGFEDALQRRALCEEPPKGELARKAPKEAANPFQPVVRNN